MSPRRLPVIMGVNVDEAGGDDAVAGIDLLSTPRPAIRPIAAIFPSRRPMSPTKGALPLPSKPARRARPDRSP